MASGNDDVTVKELKRYEKLFHNLIKNPIISIKKAFFRLMKPLGREGTQQLLGGMVPEGDCICFAHTRCPPEGYKPFRPACVNWAGEIKWMASDAPGGGKNSAGCISADGMVYFRYENGVIALVKADPAQLTLVSTFTILPLPTANSTSAIEIRCIASISRRNGTDHGLAAPYRKAPAIMSS